MKLGTGLLATAIGTMTLAPAAFAAPGEPFYLNSTHWAFATLVIFLIAVWRMGAFKAVGNMLDSRSSEIERELAQAQALREEASEKLKEAERRQEEAAEQAEAIMRQAEADAKALMAQADKDLTDMVARREAQVEVRIARAEEEATLAVKKVAADAATRAAAELIRSNAEKSSGSEAFQSALSQVKSAL